MNRKIAYALAFAVGVASVDPAYSQGRARSGGGGSRGSGGGGTAVPRSGGSGGGSVSGGASTTRQPAGGATSGRTASGGRDSGRADERGGNSDSGSANGRSGDAAAGSAVATTRDRDDQPGRGTAVRRRPGTGGPTVVVNNPGYLGGYYPWGYGGLGLGYGGYYGGFYDPWMYDPGYATNWGYGYQGSIRLKISPRNAEVYVDGYFAGEVDQYDGVFQKLNLDAGPHRIEIREEGFDALSFEVRIQPDRKITYRGELKEGP